MFEYFMFAVRNPGYVTKNARRQPQVRRNMLDFRAEHTECAYCGRDKKLDVHHKIPVSVQPGKASQKTNMIMLCRKPACHQIIGHDGDFGRRYVHNVQELCDRAQIVRTVKATDE